MRLLSHNPKKLGIPHQEMRIVRIDARTEVMVPKGMTDDDARERFRLNHQNYSHYSQGTPNYVMKEQVKEVPMGSVEDLASIVDDAELPSEE